VLRKLAVALLLFAPLIAPLAAPPSSHAAKVAAPERPLVGTAVSDPALTTDDTYRVALAERFDILTPENVMKWSEIHPEVGRYDFAAADRLVAFAEEHGQAVHGHTLAWHQQNPDWLTRGGFGRDELIDILRDHIRSVVGRYRGRIAVWDVVNEAVDEAGNLRHTIWLDGIGPDYLDIAFRTAHEADPAAQLYYNDYGAEVAGPKRDGVRRLVAGLLHRGVPVDGIGLQMHTTTTRPPTAGVVPLGAFLFRPRAGALPETMRELRSRGLDVAITEMDVRVALPATAASLRKQASVYRQARRACARAENCRSFTTWGFTDRYSWIPAFFPGAGAALPYDERLQPKPAAAALGLP
jgi:endo-1,4-beta-xylanase